MSIVGQIKMLGDSMGHVSDTNFFSSVTKINLSMEVKLTEIVNFQDSNSL